MARTRFRFIVAENRPSCGSLFVAESLVAREFESNSLRQSVSCEPHSPQRIERASALGQKSRNLTQLVDLMFQRSIVARTSLQQTVPAEKPPEGTAESVAGAEGDAKSRQPRLRTACWNRAFPLSCAAESIELNGNFTF
jgi:hypothetical protein